MNKYLLKLPILNIYKACYNETRQIMPERGKTMKIYTVIKVANIDLLKVPYVKLDQTENFANLSMSQKIEKWNKTISAAKQQGLIESGGVIVSW